jgi:hypothetical protein
MKYIDKNDNLNFVSGGININGPLHQRRRQRYQHRLLAAQ